jgi:hypothetical protein
MNYIRLIEKTTGKKEIGKRKLIYRKIIKRKRKRESNVSIRKRKI